MVRPKVPGATGIQFPGFVRQAVISRPPIEPRKHAYSSERTRCFLRSNPVSTLADRSPFSSGFLSSESSRNRRSRALGGWLGVSGYSTTLPVHIRSQVPASPEMTATKAVGRMRPSWRRARPGDINRPRSDLLAHAGAPASPGPRRQARPVRRSSSSNRRRQERARCVRRCADGKRSDRRSRAGSPHR